MRKIEMFSLPQAMENSCNFYFSEQIYYKKAPIWWPDQRPDCVCLLNYSLSFLTNEANIAARSGEELCLTTISV